MILNSAKKAAFRLANKGYIPLDDIDFITYGFFVVLSKFIYGAICVISGLVFNRFVESIVFYISFLFVRKYAGGFHASSEKRCFIYSFFSIISANFCIYLASMVIKFEYFIIVTSVLSAVLIVLNTPILSQEKDLTYNEMKIYAKYSKIRTILMMFIICVLHIANLTKIAIAIGTAMNLEGGLVMIGKIKNSSQ